MGATAAGQTSNSRPAKGGWTRVQLGELVRELVGSMIEGEADYTRTSMAAKALQEKGFPAHLVEREVIFDPEESLRPCRLHAITLQSLKGLAFGGAEEDNWDSIALQSRQQLGYPGDYIEMERCHRIDPALFLKMNEHNPHVMARITDCLEQARARVDGFMLQHGVDRPRSIEQAPGRPRI